MSSEVEASSEKPKGEVKEKPKPKLRENAIYVGKKSVMNYALATIIQFNQGAKEVVVMARGRATSKAVDVAEIVRRRFFEKIVQVKNIKIGTESMGSGNNVRNVSTIEITLQKVK